MGRKDYIFLLSHMRSYSSLLCHILGSHREISGYAEMHMYYDKWIDLIKLRLRVYDSNDNCLDGKYVLDKILHNSHTIADRVLNLSNVKIIVIIRKPVDTLRSIINMKLKRDKTSDIGLALKYYLERLDEIRKYIERLGEKAVFVESERILDDTYVVLSGLSDWLELKPKLTPKYSRFKFTGVPSYGDPSELIEKGKIIRNSISYDDIHIPPQMANRAKDAYEVCRAFMIQNCHVV